MAKMTPEQAKAQKRFDARMRRCGAEVTWSPLQWGEISVTIRFADGDILWIDQPDDKWIDVDSAAAEFLENRDSDRFFKCDREDDEDEDEGDFYAIN